MCLLYKATAFGFSTQTTSPPHQFYFSVTFGGSNESQFGKRMLTSRLSCHFVKTGLPFCMTSFSLFKFTFSTGRQTLPVDRYSRACVHFLCQKVRSFDEEKSKLFSPVFLTPIVEIGYRQSRSVD